MVESINGGISSVRIWTRQRKEGRKGKKREEDQKKEKGRGERESEKKGKDKEGMVVRVYFFFCDTPYFSPINLLLGVNVYNYLDQDSGKSNLSLNC